MTNASPRALVICGDGINCEYETEFGLNLAGFSAKRIHCSDLLKSPESLKDAKAIVFPGGFSFGDEIASGKVLSLKLRERLEDLLHQYIDSGNLVMGICNGFQILTQLGILPDSRKGAERTVSLCHNSGGRFINRWVALEVNASAPGGFFSGLTSIHLPIRHGEGKLTLAGDSELETQEMVRGHAPLKYKIDVNGSFEQIAALTNAQGNVLGLMPHPEAFVRWNQHPAWAQLKYGDVRKAALVGSKSSREVQSSESGNPDFSVASAATGESGDADGVPDWTLEIRKAETEATPHGLKILQNAAAMIK